MVEIPEPRQMRPLRTIRDRRDANLMRGRRNNTLGKARRNPNEAWMLGLLQMTGFKWKPQAIFGHRIFDFWCSHLGIAVEVDGPEHNAAYDAYRDEYNLRRHAIVVLRVRNFNCADADKAIGQILTSDTWRQRQKRFKCKNGRLCSALDARRASRSERNMIGTEGNKIWKF